MNAFSDFAPPELIPNYMHIRDMLMYIESYANDLLDMIVIQMNGEEEIIDRVKSMGSQVQNHKDN